MINTKPTSDQFLYSHARNTLLRESMVELKQPDNVASFIQDLDTLVDRKDMFRFVFSAFYQILTNPNLIPLIEPVHNFITSRIIETPESLQLQAKRRVNLYFVDLAAEDIANITHFFGHTVASLLGSATFALDRCK
jgi:hypothetical protein